MEENEIFESKLRSWNWSVYPVFWENFYSFSISDEKQQILCVLLPISIHMHLIYIFCVYSVNLIYIYIFMYLFRRHLKV